MQVQSVTVLLCRALLAGARRARPVHGALGSPPAAPPGGSAAAPRSSLVLGGVVAASVVLGEVVAPPGSSVPRSMAVTASVPRSLSANLRRSGQGCDRLGGSGRVVAGPRDQLRQEAGGDCSRAENGALGPAPSPRVVRVVTAEVVETVLGRVVAARWFWEGLSSAPGIKRARSGRVTATVPRTRRARVVLPIGPCGPSSSAGEPWQDGRMAESGRARGATSPASELDWCHPAFERMSDIVIAIDDGDDHPLRQPGRRGAPGVAARRGDRPIGGRDAAPRRPGPGRRGRGPDAG